MGQRADLNEIFVGILDGSRNVYFSPPSTVLMKYPCIRYTRAQMDQRHANNILYKNKQAYTVTVISEEPDTWTIQEKLLKLPYCSYDREYQADNLNHTVFTIYY